MCVCVLGVLGVCGDAQLLVCVSSWTVEPFACMMCVCLCVCVCVCMCVCVCVKCFGKLPYSPAKVKKLNLCSL